MSVHLFACEPGWERQAIEELAAEFAGAPARQLGPGWLELVASAAPRAPCLAWTRQGLPNARPVRAESIRQWIDCAAAAVIDGLRDHAGAWRLHVFSIPVPGGKAGPRRCALIRSGVMETLKRRQKRLLPLLGGDRPDAAPWGADEALVQVALLDAATGCHSTLLPQERSRWQRVVSRFPGGRVDVGEDKTAPSRAHRKLREALLRMGTAIGPGASCVDLGASPGGWTHVAVEAGATVVAVDRAPLAEPLMQNRQVRFERGDAFRFAPPAAVDWLLSDIVAFPQRIHDLLDRWLGARLCRRFVVTIKFRGADDYGKLQDIKRLLERRATDFEIRRLDSNKNETTAFGQLE